MAFYPGSTVRLSCRFRDVLSHIDYEPDGVTVRIKPYVVDPATPAAEDVFTYGTDDEVVRDGPGRYHIDYVPNASGVWEHRWEGDGSEPVASEGKFKVQASDFTLE